MFQVPLLRLASHLIPISLDYWESGIGSVH
jgi:hypothetical protein